MPRAGEAPNFAIAFARPTGVVAPLVVFAAMVGIASSAMAQSFTLIEPPEGTSPGTSRVYGLSADGRVAAGHSYAGGHGHQAFRWTLESGRQAFGPDLGFLYTVGFGISGDGQTIVGQNEAATQPLRAFRWTPSGQVTNLGTLPGYSISAATDASHDASVIVGNLNNGSGSIPQAFRWTQSGGMQGLGVGTTATAISGDGSTIIGEAGTAPFGFVWTSSGGTQFLPGLSGSNEGILARAINHDGSIVVGRSGPFTAKTTMWSNGAPTELVNTLPNTVFTPSGVSDAGGVVAGMIQNEFGQLFAGVWTGETSTLALADYLTANGVVIPQGVTLRECTAVSADGRTFAGYTSNISVGGIRGWVATIPVPCPADLDNDGLLSNGGTRDRAVTIDDLLFLLAAFESGNTAADLDNGSGTGTHDNAVNIDDLLYFLSHFEAGC